MLLQLADDFVETTVNAACLLAKHRHANTVEVKDVQLHLGERRKISKRFMYNESGRLFIRLLTFRKKLEYVDPRLWYGRSASIQEGNGHWGTQTETGAYTKINQKILVFLYISFPTSVILFLSDNLFFFLHLHDRILIIIRITDTCKRIKMLDSL